MALLLGALLFGAAAAAPTSSAGVCTQQPYKNIIPFVSGNQYIQAYCTSSYPVSPVKSTVSTSYTTSTVVATTTTTLSATLTPTVVVSQTNTNTILTTLSATSVETDTSTVSTTTTTTVTSTTSTFTTTTTVVTDSNGNRYKREAQATPFLGNAAGIEARDGGLRHAYPNASPLSSKYTAATQFTKSMASSSLSTLCSCIETPVTQKVTATSTVTTTSTSTVSSTTTFTSPVTTTATQYTSTTATILTTLSSTTVQTTTTTYTSTQTVSTSAVATAVVNACGQTLAGPIDGATITTLCGQQASGSKSTLNTFNGISFYQCFSNADADGQCTSFTYQYSTQQCITYRNPSSADVVASSPNSDFAFGHFNNG